MYQSHAKLEPARDPGEAQALVRLEARAAAAGRTGVRRPLSDPFSAPISESCPWFGAVPKPGPGFAPGARPGPGRAGPGQPWLGWVGPGRAGPGPPGPVVVA